MNFIVRQAIPEDAEAILNMLQKAGRETPYLDFGEEGLPYSPAILSSIISRYAGRTDGVFLVALSHESRIIGFASALASAGKRKSHRAEVSIAVLKDNWGCGAGTKLMEGIIRYGKESADWHSLMLEARSDNERALRFYRRFGFEIQGLIPDAVRIENVFYSNVIMLLNLH